MKKILPILIAFFFVLPITNAFANNGSIIFGKEINRSLTYGVLDTKTSAMTDGNDVTFSGFGQQYNYWYKFDQPADIESIKLNVLYGPNVDISFYDNDNLLISKKTIKGNNVLQSINLVNVKGFFIKGDGNNYHEISLFGEVKINKTVTDLSGVSTFNSVTLNWVNPIDIGLSNIIIKKNEIESANLAKDTKQYKITGLMPETTYTFDVISKYSDGGLFGPVNIKVTTDAAPKVTNLKAIPKDDSAVLTWNNPADLSGVRILRNGLGLVDLGKEVSSYEIKKLSAETEYTYEVVAIYSEGFQSAPVLVSFKTLEAPKEPEPAGDIVDLSVVTQHDRVDLSWVLPASTNFKHVNIYRDTLQKNLFDKVFGVKSVKAATLIFETNGTYFNDLTVKSETKYEYTLTTTSIEKKESDGVSVIVTTLKKPEPEIEGGGYEKDPETGDFTYNWTKPTTGKVKVMINDKLHATVEASNGKIIIPSADMKYTLFGKPDVQLIPVDEDGDEGKPVKPPSGGGSGNGGSDTVEMPFSAIDLLKTTFDFIKLVGPFILLFLIVYLTPRIIEIIRTAILKRGIGGKGNDE